MSRTERVGSPANIGWLPLAALALVTLTLFARVPPWPAYWGVLANAAHGPVFGVMALASLIVLRTLTGWTTRIQVVTAFTIAVGAGMVIEWLQSLIGRDPSWHDVLTDALGAAGVLALVASLQSPAADGRPKARTRVIAAAIAVFCATVIAYPLAEVASAYARRASLFPVLAEFDRSQDLYFVAPHGVTLERSRLPASLGTPTDPDSLRVLVVGGEFPGVEFTEPARDWSGWRQLRIDVSNPDSHPLNLNVRVHDIHHQQRYEDRFNRRFVLDSSSREILSMPLREVQQGPKSRSLDLGSVAGLIIFTDGQSAAPNRQYFITRIWLE